MKRTAIFRFYEELNDFLPERLRKQDFLYEFMGTPSLKDALEAIGPPHSAVDLIIADGISVGFDYQLKGGERIAVYPVFESLDITPLVRLRPAPLRDPRFVVDVNLGRLAKKLRLLGFDTLFRNDYTDHEIVAISTSQTRIILTRDRGVLKHSAVTHGYWVRNTQRNEQVREVIRRFDLENNIRLFSRCISCNGVLEPVEKEDILDRAPPHALLFSDRFSLCSGCGKLYWRGSHHDRIRKWLAHILEPADHRD